MSRFTAKTKVKSRVPAKAPAKAAAPATPAAAKPTVPTGITVATITPETTTNAELHTGVSVSGTRGAAKAITVHVTFNGMSLGEEAAILSGNKWTCDLKSNFSPPGILNVTAADDAGTVNAGTDSLTV